MRPTLRVTAMALAAGLLGACFDFGATTAGGPLDDGGTTPVSVLDGAADANSAVDGSSATPDATLGGSEGGSDAGSDSGSAPPPVGDGGYCAGIARPVSGIFFCDDFDESQLPGPWSAYNENAGLLNETDAGAVSPPNSVDETTTALTYDEAVDVSLRYEPLAVPSLPTTLTFSFAVRLVRFDTTANAAIVLGAVDFLDGAGNRYSVELAINVTSGGAAALVLGEQSGFVDGGDPYVSHPLPPTQPLVTGTWTTLAITIDWTASSTTASVSVNGATVLSPVGITMTVQPTFLQIGVGTSYVTEYPSQSSPIWELMYDNVLFTAQ